MALLWSLVNLIAVESASDSVFATLRRRIVSSAPLISAGNDLEK
jgi:hypothetical protein